MIHFQLVVSDQVEHVFYIITCRLSNAFCTSSGTGYIEFEEFVSIVRKKMQDDEDERELREMFRILDKEKRGEVNTNELRCASSKISIL